MDPSLMTLLSFQSLYESLFFTKDIKVLGILSLLISIEIFIVKKQVTGIYKTAEVDSHPWVLAKDMNLGKTAWAYI